jgi:hypothetical protein
MAKIAAQKAAQRLLPLTRKSEVLRPNYGLRNMPPKIVLTW